MPRAAIRLDIPDVYDQRAIAKATAEEIANIIGDQVESWEISISEPKDASFWLIEVTGRGRRWSFAFDGDDQTERAIVEQFRLELSPWIPGESEPPNQALHPTAADGFVSGRG